MKKNNRIFIFLLLIGFLLIFNSSCTKDDSIDPSNTVKDIDGNNYHTVTIGTQIWMVENLKTTRYRNGDPIPNKTDATEWGKLSTGAYCNYDNTVSNSNIYGKLYNWYAISDSRNIAPVGWHIPTSEEWTTLTEYLKDDAVNKLKEVGTIHWGGSNTDATNETGFTALPGGGRFPDLHDMGVGAPLYLGCNYLSIGYAGCWWTSDGMVITMNLDNNINSSKDYNYYYYSTGLSVRCVKD
jgi:uncharacterized protein (TIGR02145 family)